MTTKIPEELPRRVKIIKKVSIYEPGNILTSFWDGEIYKLEGAIFGLSPKQVKEALLNGSAIEYPTT